MRILCPSDASAGAGAAVDKVLATFAPAGALVDLLGVAESSAGGEGAGHRTAALDLALAAERLRLEAAGFAVETSVRSGRPDAAILAHAAAVPPDLIVLGARGGGHPAGGEGAGGSSPGTGAAGHMAAAVARAAHVPVLIARDGEAVTRVVLGYDESPDADAALALLVRLPWRTAPSVDVCSTWEVGDTLLPSALGDDAAKHHAAPPEDLEESRLAGLDIARDAAERLRGQGIAATAHARHGRPSAELEILAALVAADLIVVGSRGLSSADRFVLGSTSDELVATARTSVLAVRS